MPAHVLHFLLARLELGLQMCELLLKSFLRQEHISLDIFDGFVTGLHLLSADLGLVGFGYPIKLSLEKLLVKI